MFSHTHTREDANELCHDFTIRCEVRRPVGTIDLVDGPVGRVSDDSGDGGDEGGETGGDSPVSTRDEPKSPLHTTTSGSSKSNRKTNNYSLSKSLIGTKSNTILRTVTRTIYTAGRPPWYDAQGQLLEPLIIGKIRYYFLYSMSILNIFADVLSIFLLPIFLIIIFEKCPRKLVFHMFHSMNI